MHAAAVFGPNQRIYLADAYTLAWISACPQNKQKMQLTCCRNNGKINILLKLTSAFILSRPEITLNSTVQYGTGFILYPSHSLSQLCALASSLVFFYFFFLLSIFLVCFSIKLESITGFNLSCILNTGKSNGEGWKRRGLVAAER